MLISDATADTNTDTDTDTDTDADTGRDTNTNTNTDTDTDTQFSSSTLLNLFGPKKEGVYDLSPSTRLLKQICPHVSRYALM